MMKTGTEGEGKGAFPLTKEELARVREEAMDFANVGIYRYRLDGTLVYIDAGVLRLLDIEDQVSDPAEMFGRNISELMQYVEEPRSLRSLTLEHGFVRNLEYHYRTLKGEDRWVYHNAYLVEDKRTGEKEFQVLARDITELKRSLLAREASERRWRALIEGSLQGFVVFAGSPSRIVLVNKALMRMLGKTESDLVGLEIQDLIAWFHPEDREAALARFSGLPDPAPGSVPPELRLSLDGDRTIWVELRYSVVEYDGLEALQMCVTDVTTRVEAQRQRQEIDANMHDAQRLESLGVLAGGVAHDFNNLLAAILGNVEFLRDGVTGSTDLEFHVEEITHATERAAELCRQLLAYSGRRPLARQPLDLNDLIEDTTRLIDVTVSRRAQMVRELTPELPFISGDASQVRQVLMNLITNAAEALGSEPGCITIRTGASDLGRGELGRCLMGDGLPPGRYVHVEVQDDGCGMEDDVCKRIFDPFFTTKFTGRGLGLAAVRGIVRSHGGAFDVESRPGQGTRIRVLFPVCDQRPSARRSSPVMEDWRGSGTVLLADDEAAPRNIMVRLLKAIGFECVCASNGEEAVQYFREDPDSFRLAVLDVVMPVCDGPKCLHQLRRLRPGLPALFISGYDDESLKVELADPSTAFLQKPFPMRALREQLRHLLAGDSLLQGENAVAGSHER
ncbi:MAG: hypothetical protein CVU59_09245 [Deltaproteobacteria bacterium HGW-Deltaproteobacteria-17]|nr:MAG: hypothetical protein CVU59_09245 [Deltaproteobacteria bacterium HGW-Deltaproteobacteria-17]